MDITGHKEKLLKYGFVKMKGVLNKAEFESLKSESLKLMDKPPLPWSEHSKYKFAPDRGSLCFSDKVNSSVYTNLPGQSELFDSLLEKVVTHPSVQGLLAGIMGPGYKLWHVGIREAVPNGAGMALHQDYPGEISLSILLTDTPTIAGTTIFVPKSHLCPLSIQETLLNRLPLKMLRRIFDGATGAAGDLCFFIGRTYHGRYPHDAKGNICISMDFFAVGARYYVQRTPQAALEKMGPELRRLLDPEVGLKYLEVETGKAEVLPTDDYGTFKPDPAFSFVLNGRGNLSIFSPWRILQLIALLFSGRKNIKSWFTYHLNSFLNKKKPA